MCKSSFRLDGDVKVQVDGGQFARSYVHFTTAHSYTRNINKVKDLVLNLVSKLA